MNRSSVVVGLLATSAVLFACGPSAPIESVPSHPPAGYELVFAEEFDGAELGAEWVTCYWWQVDEGCTIASNDEQQWYRPEAVSVDRGALELRATEDSQETTDGDVLPYRSGVVTTGHLDNDTDDLGFAFTYGYIEARIQLPEGDGLWPAVWLLSADRTSLPEIDLFEWYGSREAISTSHVHQRVDDERSSERVDTVLTETADRWHTVAAEWTDESVTFFLDGVITGRVDDSQLVPTTPMYIIVNLALGGPAGEVDDDALPQVLRVDHVRVWQKVDQS
jgi:beta-glucanase (GH16 family)